MRVIPEQIKQLLRVDQNFARLVSSDNNSSDIIVSYFLLKEETSRSKCSKVRITAYREKQTIPAVTDVATPAHLPMSILTRHQVVRKIQKQNVDSSLAILVSDFGKRLINDVPIRQVKLVDPRIAKSQVQFVNHLTDQNSLTMTYSLATRLVMEDGIDPATVASIKGAITRPADLMAGVHRKMELTRDDLSQYYRSIIAAEDFASPRQTSVYDFDHNSDPEVEIFESLRLPVRFDSLTELFFDFELIDSSGKVQNKITRRLKTSKEFDILSTPITPPAIEVAQNTVPGSVRLMISQKDPAAKSVILFKRVFDHTSSLRDEEWDRIDDFDLVKSDGVHAVDEEVSSVSTTIFRAIAVGEYGAVGHDFSSVTLKPARDIATHVYRSPRSSRNFSHISLVTQIVESGVSVQIRSLPADAICVRVSRSVFSPSGYYSDTVFLQEFTTGPHRDVYTFIDSGVTANVIYVYSTTIVYSDGTEDKQGSSIVNYIPLSSNLIDVKINSLASTSTGDQVDVRFDVLGSIIPTSVDSIRDALASSGIVDLFGPEILQQRDQLQGLIVFSVDRIDLTSGLRESFRTLSSSSFSDSALGPINSVDPLQFGHSYRYEVSAFLRQPESMLTSFVKTSVDPASKRQYSFKPSKFSHPLALNKGAIAEPAAIMANHSEDQFAFGNIGAVVSAEVTIPKATADVVNLSATQVDPETIEIRWNLSGSPAVVDHFLVGWKTKAGRELIGKAHVFQPSPTFFFLKKVMSSEVGEECTFFVIPILLDYTRGKEAISPKISISTTHAYFSSGKKLKKFGSK